MTHLIVALWLALLPNTVLPASLAGASAVRTNSFPWITVASPTSGQPIPLQLKVRLAGRTTNYNHATASQALNIELAAKRLNGAVIDPASTFSYYALVGPYTAANGYGWGRAFVGDRIVPSIGGGVCQGASTLYSAVLRTDLTVLERHQHGLMVPYLPPGEDATVSSDYLNFRFRNNQPSPVLIMTEASHRKLQVTLWGAVPGPKITVHHQILERFPFRTIVQRDPNLKPGETKILAPGQDGVIAKTWVTVDTNGTVKTRDLGIDRYRPSPRIVAEGPATT